MLTKSDLNNIDELFEKKIEFHKFATKEDISHLPSKDEFYEMMDQVMGELKAIREEFAILTGRVYSDHEPRIIKLEETVGLQTS